MTESELRQAIHETLEGIKKLRVASQTHPVEAMRELRRKRMLRAKRNQRFDARVGCRCAETSP